MILDGRLFLCRHHTHSPLLSTTTTMCVYLDRQIALPIWGATHGLKKYNNICISFSIFVILVHVVFFLFSPTFHLVFFSKYCVFVFPSQVFSIFFLKKCFSWLEFISPVFVSCVVLLFFFFFGSIFPSIFCIKFHYFAG